MGTLDAVSHKISEGLAVQTGVRGFKCIIDEPASPGGTDRRMNPVEAMLAGPGSCQCIVAAAFVKAQGVGLKDFQVELESDLDTDGFIRSDPNVRSGCGDVRFTMQISTGSPKEKVEAFQKLIEARCPFGNSLGRGIMLKSSAIVVEARSS